MVSNKPEEEKKFQSPEPAKAAKSDVQPNEKIG